MTDQALRARDVGFLEHEAPALAHGQAVSDAVAIAAFATATFPASPDGFGTLVGNQIVARLQSFALHVRRDLELRGLRGLSVTGGRWTYESVSYETSVWTIVNRILHARSMHIRFVDRGQEVFSNLGDCFVLYVVVESDQGGPTYFDPLGLVFAYLSQIPEIQPLPTFRTG
ncbi:hypothetical protein CCR92_21855 [Rhodospirillum rubrum]|nr:hypothetical protein [Rhodospirillum rubrum]